MTLFRQLAADFDARDPLAAFREQFVLDEILYLDGNSLGRLPKATVDRMRHEVEGQWGGRLIRGWGEGWLDLPRTLGDKVARLIGARPGEVLVCDSTSVNFFKLVGAVLGQTERRVVVTNQTNFPSDLYLLQGLGVEVRVVASENDREIAKAIDDQTALVTLSHVEFKSGLRHDLAYLNDVAHQHGALSLWDLSHSVGAVDVRLGTSDLAIGCGYKYLNGGPGAPAFLYVRQDLQASLRSPIQGWFGQRDAFAFGTEYQPAEGIDRFMAGTPPILAMAALEPGLDILIEAGISAVAEKAKLQTDFLLQLADAHLAPLGFEAITPRETRKRGSHVALRHPEAWRIDQALIQQMNVIPDFRSPDVLRLGIAPLYTRFVDLVEAVARIETVVRERRYETFESSFSSVT